MLTTMQRPRHHVGLDLGRRARRLMSQMILVTRVVIGIIVVLLLLQR